MTQKYLSQLRREGAIAEIAKVKFPFPGAGYPELDTIVNVPKRQLTVGSDNGKDLFPDIVVVRRPGQWLQMMVEVEMPDTLTDESALTDWLPMSKVGNLYLYVPTGCVPQTKALLKKHGIKVAGIRTWRFRPVWGLDVAEA